jgi:tetratricopeptide (TPR) repeat protein
VVGADADVDKAVEAADQAVHAAGPYPEHPDRARAAVMLGNALRVRYEKTGDQSDLSAAITSLRQAADATPSHDRNYAAIQSGLGEALLNRHEGVFSDEDLDESIASFEKALAATAAENPARVRYLSQLASALTERISLTESDEREGSRYQADYGRLAEIEALLGQSAPETRPETAG